MKIPDGVSSTDSDPGLNSGDRKPEGLGLRAVSILGQGGLCSDSSCSDSKMDSQGSVRRRPGKSASPSHVKLEPL